jgi:hypothetical protein
MDLETTAASRKNAEMVTHTNDETTWNDMKRLHICYNIL